MKKCVIFLVIASIVVLSGCMGPQASFSEQMKDAFFFTSAQKVDNNVKKCITLTRPYSFKSGDITYSLPAGRYVAKKKRSTGYFYYAPKPIRSKSNFLLYDGFKVQDGIYLENNANKGNLFGHNPDGFDIRPVRQAVLPKAIFSYIKRNTRC